MRGNSWSMSIKFQPVDPGTLMLALLSTKIARGVFLKRRIILCMYICICNVKKNRISTREFVFVAFDLFLTRSSFARELLQNFSFAIIVEFVRGRDVGIFLLKSKPTLVHFERMISLVHAKYLQSFALGHTIQIKKNFFPRWIDKSRFRLLNAYDGVSICKFIRNHWVTFAFRKTGKKNHSQNMLPIHIKYFYHNFQKQKKLTAPLWCVSKIYFLNKNSEIFVV